MLAHKSRREFHTAEIISFAAGVEADVCREKMNKKKALEAKAREAAYRAKMCGRKDHTPGDRMVER